MWRATLGGVIYWSGSLKPDIYAVHTVQLVSTALQGVKLEENQSGSANQIGDSHCDSNGACPQQLGASPFRGCFLQERTQRTRQLLYQNLGRGWQTWRGWRTLGVSATRRALPTGQIMMDTLTWAACEYNKNNKGSYSVIFVYLICLLRGYGQEVGVTAQASGDGNCRKFECRAGAKSPSHPNKHFTVRFRSCFPTTILLLPYNILHLS